MREVRVKALAKINLSLKVLHKRSDNFHELRTIFQTISLGDTLAIRYEPARRSNVTLDSTIDIPDNLVTRPAHAMLDPMKGTARIHFKLGKPIPMGDGLGRDSTHATALLLALPALA